MTIDEKLIPWILTAIAVLIAFLTYLGNKKKEVKKDAGCEAGMQLDLAYIKRGVDDIRIDQQRMREDMGQMSERITRCEENCKSAHKRIDGLEK